MNVVRRILLVFYSLVLLGALGGIGTLAWQQDEQLDLNIGDLNLQALVTADDEEKYALTGVLAGVGIVALLTLFIALWPNRARTRGAMRIRQADGGTVEVTAEAIESLLRDELESLPEVHRATPRVSLAGGAIETYIDAQIEPSASIAHATKLLGSSVEEVLREQIGVTAVRRPTIRITYDEMAARPVPANRVRASAATAPDLRPQKPSDPPTYPATASSTVARPEDAPRYSSTTDDEESPAT